MTNSNPDALARVAIDQIERLAFDLRPPNATTPQIVQACVQLRTALSRLQHDNEALEKHMEDCVQERIVELDAEAAAFDKESVNALTYILTAYCGDAGLETINDPDGWGTDQAVETIAEEFGWRDREIERLRARDEAADRRVEAMREACALEAEAQTIVDAKGILPLTRDKHAGGPEAAVAIRALPFQPRPPDAVGGADNSSLAERLWRIHSALDDAVGDTDISHVESDDELRQEHPVQWAAMMLAHEALICEAHERGEHAITPPPTEEPDNG